MRSGWARPAPRGPGLQPWLGAADRPPSLPSSLPFSLPAAARGRAAGPTPGAAGRGRLPAGLSFPSPAPARGPPRPARALFPRRPHPFPGLSVAEDRVSCSPLLSSPAPLPHRARPSPLPSSLLSAPLQPLGTLLAVPGAVSRLPFRGREQPPVAPGSCCQGRRRRALRGAGARAGVPLPAERTDRPCPRNQEPGLTESSVQGNERGARASPAA